MDDILVLIAYLIIGGLIGYAVRAFLDTLNIIKRIDGMNERLNKWQKSDEEHNKLHEERQKWLRK